MAEITRPQSPSTTDKQTTGYSPDQLNPELAQMAMMRSYAERWPLPIFISKKYAVFFGLWQGVNHDPLSKTPSYFDASPRLAVYHHVGFQTPNIDGKLFTSLFTAWNKPKIVMQGVNQIQSGFEDEKPGIISRIWGGITGKNKQETNNQ